MANFPDVIVGDVHSTIDGQSDNQFLCDSISLNFEGDVVALGTSNIANGNYTYQGKVEISIWNSTTKRWNYGSGNNNAVAQTLLGNHTGNTTNVKFGNEVSLDWDGNRLAVGAPGVNKVMVFDATGAGTNKWSSYVSNTLTVPSISSSAEFGFSVSLSQEKGETLAVGAPGIDTAYIFEFNAANAPNEWGTGPVRTIQGSNAGTSGNNTQLKNLIPSSINTELTAYTGFRWCHGIPNRFGHKVRLTHFADYLIIGAPGTREASVNSSNTYDSENGTTPISYTNSVQSQLGHARVYTSPQGQSWGGSNVYQHGQTLQGGVANQLSVNSNNTMQPEFGTSCDVSWDGKKVVVGSPYFPSMGQIKTYLYNDDTNQYEKTPTSIEGNIGLDKMGMNLRLDYAGERMVSGRVAKPNQESEYYSGGSMSIFDFAKDRWYELSLPLRLEPAWGTQSDQMKNPCDITSGKLACMGNPSWPRQHAVPGTCKGQVRFYEFAITQSIHGNQNIGGHLKAEQIFIGSNDNTSNVNQSKRLSFGGTYLDNAYNQTFIENRLINSSGQSELLLFKKNDLTENQAHEHDCIRIKAAEIRFDFHDGYHGGHDEPDSMRTRLFMNKAGQVAVGNAYWNGSFQTIGGVCLDVNDSSYFRNLVNIANETNRPMNTTVNIDTNNDRLFKGLGTDSELIGSTAETQLYRTNIPNGTWDPEYKAFYLDDTGSASFCINNDPGNWHNSYCQCSVWIRLNDTQANCAGQLAWFLYNLATGGGHNGCRCNLTATGLEFRYEENTTSNNLVANYTFNQNQWYHIGIQMPAEGNYPQNGNTLLYINGAAQSLTWPGTYIYAGSHNGYWDDIGFGIGAYPWYDDVHPTVEMTQNSMNNYVASASQQNNLAYNAFTLEYKESGNSTWSTNNSTSYTPDLNSMTSPANSNAPTTSYSGGTARGEWIQLQLPQAETFVGVQFGCARKKSWVPDIYLNGMPASGKILGSTNGSSWNLVNEFTGLTRTGYVNRDFQNTKFGSTSASYQYWRVVITELCDIVTNVVIAQIGFIKSFTSMGVKKMWVARFGIGEGGYGPGKEKILPNEMLTVGGTANIAKGLTINTFTASNYELDVNGDINLTGNLRRNGVIQALGASSGETFINGLLSNAGTHPSSAMSGNSSGGYVASASSESPSDWKAWKAFNQVIGGEGWHSSDAYSSSNGFYSGSTSTTYDTSSSVSGEWIQLQLSSGISINEIEIAPRTNFLNRCAGGGRILGSNDGSTWSSIATFSGKTYTNGTYTNITFTTSPMYTYFRVVITNLSGTGAQPVNISEMRFTSVDVPDTTNIYYPSSGTTNKVGINNTSPTRYLDVAGTLDGTHGGLLLRNGDDNAASYNAPQIAFGFNGSNTYQHFMRTRHNSSAGNNSIDFFVCDGTGNNSLTSGTTHNLTLESGKVGMNGITEPTAPLHINASSTGSGPNGSGIFLRQSNPNKNAVIAARVNGSGNGNPYVSWDIEGVAGWSAGIDNNNGDCWDLCENWDLNSSSGNVVAQAIRGSGRTKFIVYEQSGSTTAASNWPSWGGGFSTWDILCMSISYSGLSQRSDRNLKDNIVDIPVGLSQILQLRPVRYTWKDVPDGGPHYGLIAQEAESIIPELVRHDGDNNTYRIKQEIVPILIKATQELNTKVTTLETDNASLKTQVATLETQVADLISRVTALENA